MAILDSQTRLSGAQRTVIAITGELSIANLAVWLQAPLSFCRMQNDDC